MKTNFQKVKDFHEAFGIEKRPPRYGLPVQMGLVQEEFKELADAYNRFRRESDKFLVLGECSSDEEGEFMKEAADLLYTVYGLYVALGADADAVFNLVHENNMTKLQGERKFSPEGKLLKPKGFKRLTSEEILSAAYGAEAQPGQSLIEDHVRSYEEVPDELAPGHPSGWDNRFLQMAELVASWSKDPSTNVGAVITRPDNTIVSLGFNGFPRGVEDDPELLNDRKEKYARVIHAEMNAVLNAGGNSLKDCTLYTWPLPPCSNCAAMIIQAGIRRIVAPRPSNDRWEESNRIAHDMFSQAGVSVTYY